MSHALLAASLPFDVELASLLVANMLSAWLDNAVVGKATEAAHESSQNHRASPQPYADFEHRRQAAKKDLTQLWVTCHEAANESRDFTTASEARQPAPPERRRRKVRYVSGVIKTLRTS
jgi:hypothetical protein